MKKLLSYLALLMLAILVPATANAWTFYVDATARNWSNVKVYTKWKNSDTNYGWNTQSGTKLANGVYKFEFSYSNLDGIGFGPDDSYNNWKDIDGNNAVSWGDKFIGCCYSGNSGNMKMEDGSLYVLASSGNNIDNRISSYSPTKVYLLTNPSGTWNLTGTSKTSSNNVFTWTDVELAGGQNIAFAHSNGSWGNINATQYGVNSDVTISLSSNTYTGDVTYRKTATWKIGTNDGGTYDITLNTSTKKVTFTKKVTKNPEITVSPSSYTGEKTSLNVTLTPNSDCEAAKYSLDGGTTKTAIPANNTVTLTNTTSANKTVTLTTWEGTSKLGTYTYNFQVKNPGVTSNKTAGNHNGTTLELTLSPNSNTTKFDYKIGNGEWVTGKTTAQTFTIGNSAAEGDQSITVYYKAYRSVTENGKTIEYTPVEGSFAYTLKHSISFKLHGSFTSSTWSDVELTYDNGVWKKDGLSVTYADAAFGIKRCENNVQVADPNGWLYTSAQQTVTTLDDNRTLQLMFKPAGTDPGKNIKIQKGTYNLSYNPSTKVLTVTSTNKPKPSVTFNPAAGTYDAKTKSITMTPANCGSNQFQYSLDGTNWTTATGAKTITIGSSSATADQNITVYWKASNSAYTDETGSAKYVLKYQVTVTGVKIHQNGGNDTAFAQEGSNWVLRFFDCLPANNDDSKTKYYLTVSYSDGSSKNYVPDAGNAGYWLGNESKTLVTRTTGFFMFNSTNPFTSGKKANITVTFNTSNPPVPTMNLQATDPAHDIYVYGPLVNGWDDHMHGLGKMITTDGVTYTWTTNESISTSSDKRYFRLYDATANRHIGWNTGDNYTLSNNDTWYSVGSYESTPYKCLFMNITSDASTGVTISYQPSGTKVKFSTNAGATYYFKQRQGTQKIYDPSGADIGYADVDNTRVPLLSNGDGTYSAKVVEVRASGVLTSEQVTKITGQTVTNYQAPDRSFIISNSAGNQVWGANDSGDKVRNGETYVMSTGASESAVTRANMYQTVVADPNENGTVWGRPETYRRPVVITFNPTTNQLTIKGDKPKYTIYGTFNKWDFKKGHEVYDISDPAFEDSGVFGVFIPSLTNGTNDDNPGFKILTNNRQHNTRSWGRQSETNKNDKISSAVAEDIHAFHQIYSCIANGNEKPSAGKNNLMLENSTTENVMILFFPEDDLLNGYHIRSFTLIGGFNDWNSKDVMHSFTPVSSMTGEIKYKLTLDNLQGSFKIVQSGTNTDVADYDYFTVETAKPGGQGYVNHDKNVMNHNSVPSTLPTTNGGASAPRRATSVRAAVADRVHEQQAMHLESRMLENVEINLVSDGASTPTLTMTLSGDPVYNLIVNGQHYNDANYRFTKGEDGAYYLTVPEVAANAQVEVSTNHKNNEDLFGAATSGKSLLVGEMNSLVTGTNTDVKTLKNENKLKNVTFIFNPEAQTLFVKQETKTYRLAGSFSGWGVNNDNVMVFSPVLDEEGNPTDTYVLTIPELELNAQKGASATNDGQSGAGFKVAVVSDDSDDIAWYGSSTQLSTSDTDGVASKAGQDINLNSSAGNINLSDNTKEWLDACQLVLTVDSDGNPVSLNVKSTVSTEIDTVEADLYPADVYTLTGVCILRDAKAEDLYNLVPGIYIYKGKKLLVK